MASEKPDSFQCGQFEVARNPNVSQFVEKLNRLREAVDQCRLQPGVGYTLNRSSGGTTLSIKTSAEATQAINKRPFAISIRKKDNKYEFYVTTGLFNNGTAIENLEKWVGFNSEPPTIIYLEAKLSNLDISSVTIKSKKQDVLETIEISGGKQTFARIALGFYSGSGKSFNIIQNVVTNINTTNVCHDGFPALALSQESVAG